MDLLLQRKMFFEINRFFEKAGNYTSIMNLVYLKDSSKLDEWNERAAGELKQ
jgi:hypothetical protein